MKQYNFPKGSHPRPPHPNPNPDPQSRALEEQINLRIDAHRDGEFPELGKDAAYVALSNELIRGR